VEPTNEKTGHLGRKGRIKTWAFRSGVVIALLAAGIYFSPKILYSFSHEETDNAYIQGLVVPVSSEVKGRVTNVLVEDNQPVEVGDPLVEIDQEDYQGVVTMREGALSQARAAEKSIRASIEEKTRGLSQARAKHQAAQASRELAKKDFERYSSLLKDGSISQSRYDEVESQWQLATAGVKAAHAEVQAAQAAIDTLKARLDEQRYAIEEAEASLKLAKLDLKRTVMTAPISGNVTKKNVDSGKYVQSGQPLLAIVDKHDIWVEANFKETQVEKMKKGQPVDVSVDAYPGVVFKGHVDSFQHGTGAVFSLLPPDNATGNFVKVVQRVPVKIVLDSPIEDGRDLWPGLSVTASVDVNVSPAVQNARNDR